MFKHIQKGGLLLIRTGQVRRYEYTFKREEKSMFTDIQKGGQLLIRAGQARRPESL
jgi:hypothetical protein